MDEMTNTADSESPRPPVQEAIYTGSCLILGVAGFIVQQLPIDNAFGWSLIPLIGAYAFGGFQTAVAAISSLARRELNVDSLMIIAAIGAAILGEWVEGVVLLFLFSLSGTLEKFASYRTSKSIESLVQLRPSTATRLLVEANEDQVVPIDQLQLGDRVRVKPGERFPVDGTVLEGESWADESTLTGESVPVPKQKGSPVFSGTLNSRGTVVVEMTKLISDSTIERIVHMVHHAQSQKTPTQKLVESWQQPYVLSVLIGAVVVFFGVRWFHTTDWGDAFYHAMVILVAASPCAVVLSSPAVMLSAIALAGRYGILVKGGVHLEQLGRLDVLAMGLQHRLQVSACLRDIQPGDQGFELAHDPGLTPIEELQPILDVWDRHRLAMKGARRARRRGAEGLDRPHQHAAPVHFVLVNVAHQGGQLL